MENERVGAGKGELAFILTLTMSSAEIFSFNPPYMTFCTILSNVSYVETVTASLCS